MEEKKEIVRALNYPEQLELYMQNTHLLGYCKYQCKILEWSHCAVIDDFNS